MSKKGLFFLLILLFLIIVVTPILAADQFPIYFNIDSNITIDGQFNDWPITIPCIINSDTQITNGERKSAENFNGLINSFFDNKNMYISAIIKDSTPLMNNFKGNDIYQGDCLEVYIGFHDKVHSSYQNDYQFGLSLTSGGIETWHWTKGEELTAYDVKIVTTKEGYQLEAKIPLSNFDIQTVNPGQTVWFDFGLDNGQGKDTRSTQMIAFGDGTGWQTAEVWKKAYLTKDEKIFNKPYIITPPSFKTEKYHRIYVWYKGEFLNDLPEFKSKFEVDNRAGYVFKPDREVNLSVSAKIDGYEINKVINVEKSKEEFKIVMPVRDIKVNQVGYLPDSKKYFILTDNSGELTERKFTILTSLSQDEVFSGKIVGPIEDKTTGDILYYGDFSELNRPGMYKIKINGFENSYVFNINNKIYKNLFYETMRSYYLQRCGIDLNDDISNINHQACHLDDAYLKTNPDVAKDVTGGWHDAGDFGKYIPPAGVTVAQLSLMYQLAGDKVSNICLDIPESNNEIADVIDELKYELDWMLKMQAEDGGVYHKVTPANFAGMILPDNDTNKRYVYEKGTADTAIFAGALALAADTLKDIDSNYARRLKTAAVAAAEFLRNQEFDLWPSNDNTGAYTTSNLSDEKFWCYAQLYKLTGQREYLDLAADYIDKVREIAPISWDNTSALAVYALLSSDNLPDDLKNKLQDRLIQHAEMIVSKVNSNGYPTSLGESEYYWASNKVALAYGVNLVLANQFNSDERYINAARKQIDYILGMNALSKSFLTDLGTDDVKYPHHRLVIASGQLIPGLLVGGPNNNADDGLYDKGLKQKGYLDDEEAYSCNEYAIDYNAPFVFLTGYFIKEW
ncbi:hypothetical protein GM661_08065 [Iocasia frigidifontis]|uniref:Endoglucanase n=1 Tax=Iocasia fonsfrigidae TaxID=2682810 RepID=A0A8A7KCV6_9FIRM|nr:glycoside hydrolase family 9 protein [Iocasia fonsfrigidae]QTL97935.1 hypothetical protein GM661_08065 [Iocasia fonsfrigidae]